MGRNMNGGHTRIILCVGVNVLVCAEICLCVRGRGSVCVDCMHLCGQWLVGGFEGGCVLASLTVGKG